MTTLLIATRNAHKVREIGQILGDNFHCLNLGDFPDAPVPIEDAPTFEGNAKKKIASLAEWLLKNQHLISTHIKNEEPFFLLADDSGLEVDALGGAPGVHSARFAAEDSGVSGNAPDSSNNAKLLRLLDGVPAEKRTARFRCVLALLQLKAAADGSAGASPYRSDPGRARLLPSHGVKKAQRPSPEIIIFDGACEGRISSAASGPGGFGYDPLFVPQGCAQSFAALGDDLKNKLSHRARALEKLRHFLVG